MSRPRDFAEAEELFHGPGHDCRRIPNVLERLLAAGLKSIQAHQVVSERPLTESLPALAPRGKAVDFRAVFAADGMISGELSGAIGRQDPRRVAGDLLAFRHPNYPIAWIILTSSTGDFERVLLPRLFDSARPRCVRPLIRTSQIQQLFSDVANIPDLKGPIQKQGRAHKTDMPSVPRVVQRGTRGPIKSPGATKPVEADRKWTDLSIDEAFKEAREAEQWVTDATLAYRWEGEEGRIKISREGTATFRGIVKPIFWPVMDSISRSATERYRFLRDRARSRDNSFQSRPFKIAFRSIDLGGTEERELLRTVLRSIPNATCTVLHGNPYFHAVLVDYLDGSSYEVLILQSREMTIIPQGRSTAAALQRFCGRLFKDFREGEIKEATS